MKRHRAVIGSLLAASLAVAAALAVGIRVLAPGTPSREITIVARGMAFRIEGDGRENPEIPVAAGERLILRFRNEDRGVDHDLTVPALGVGSGVLHEGEEATVEIVVPEPGRLEYLCALHPRMMKGLLIVTP